ncbi:amino acid ABC transporter ATP-binding protein [Devosia riboflavina]|uniref:Amino acid ABC transporter ATP-binding protein n=1 Tax=Devosia riboflavina TaxID=46914 RepID=A0A087M3Q8_9HYPH|nr:ABC transporter ATP-binding protein [Devosia riboflavina]KFL31511.1 amino acid ABC transporter ATP-binding protein [Devosia riboflavina]
MIEIEHLSKFFDETCVVDDVSMTIPDGALAVIVGTSGSGKTTLLRMINRLVEPSSGRILIDGKDISAIPPHELRRQIGYAIQSHGLFPHRTVGQNIATVPHLLHWEATKVNARVDELLDLFQLDPAEFRDRYPSQLSGGQQQRVGVARALAAAPKLLLMDEPFGALDPIIRARAQEDLRQIQRRLGTTIVLVTHDMNEAIHLGDRIAVMDRAKLLQYDTPQEIVTRPATDFVGELLGSGERPFRLLSLQPLRPFIEQGEATGTAVSVDASLRDALEEALWSGRAAVPVRDGAGKTLGRVTLATAIRQAARPQ